MTAKTSLVPALRATWRKSAQHALEQLSRFLRLTVLAAIPSVTNLISGGKFDWRTLLAFVLPFGEVAYRQVFPALGAAAVDAAPGATIVPEQVAPDPAGVSTVDPATGLALIEVVVLVTLGLVLLLLAGVIHAR